jgi:hydrogenase maturation protease
MSRQMSRAVIGIGSPHGQDALGWLVVERLSKSKGLATQWILAKTPAEILDRCEGVDELHLVDACIGTGSGRLHRLQWPNDRMVDLRWTNTHGIDVPGALHLAAELGMLPASVTIWAIECEGNLVDGSWSNAGQQEIESAAEQIARALQVSIPSSETFGR